MEKRIAPCFAVVIVLLSAAFVGCEKKPSPIVSRAKDPAYQKQLESLLADQNSVATRRARIEKMMDEIRHRAKASLGESATDAQIEAEIAAHTERYPAWKTLKDQLAETEKAAQQNLEKARTTVRDRILKERADRAAVDSKK